VTDQWRVEALEWDSEFWRRRVGRVSPDTDPDRGGKRVDGLENTLDELDLAYLLWDADDVVGVQRSERAGFRMVDVRCEVSLALGHRTLSASSTIRPVETAVDLEAAAGLAAVAHRNTRFGQDPCLDPDRVGDLYRAWMVRDFERADWKVLLAIVENRVAGYITHGPITSMTGTIGLIAVDPNARGAGLGRQLLDAALIERSNEGSTTMKVVTQGGSQAAMRMYQSAGFAVEQLGIWMHWHRR